MPKKYNIAAKKSKSSQKEILVNHFAAACPQRGCVMAKYLVYIIFHRREF